MNVVGRPNDPPTQHTEEPEKDTTIISTMTFAERAAILQYELTAEAMKAGNIIQVAQTGIPKYGEDDFLTLRDQIGVVVNDYHVRMKEARKKGGRCVRK